MKNLRHLRIGTVIWLAAFSAVCVEAQVDVRAVGSDRVSITINGQPFSDFYVGNCCGKPFLAPLRTAAGLIVTRRFPMEQVEGESSDHPHHRGLWMGYGNVNHINFWENDPNSKTSGDNPTTKGLIVLEHLDSVKSGKKSGSITATFRWGAPGHGDVLEEQRVTTFYADQDIRTLDVDTSLTAKTQLEFGDTKEGFFAIRIADSMTEKNGGMLTNSEGAQTDKNVWGKRANWVDYDGTVEGQKVGIVIFDNPQNLNHPPHWHARAYGLFAVNPLGLKEFDVQSTEHGGYSLPAGKTLRLRYRVIIHPGDVPKRKIEGWYGAYTKKAK